MSKVLILFNGVGYPAHVIDFAIKMTKEKTSLLYAVFMKPLHVTESLQYPFPNDLSMTADNIDTADQERTDIQAIEDNKQLFRNECERINVTCKIDEEIEKSLDDLIEQSKFSDLIIADVNDDLGKYSIGDLLSGSKCPVILVQRQTEIPDQVILAYDGSSSSLQAIKMYSYLLPEWRDLKTNLVQVNPQVAGKISNERYLGDWLSQHFSQLEITTLQGNVQNELTAVLNSHSRKTMMVMGAYEKKGLAGIFHTSLANKMIDLSHVSLFISHV